MAECYVYALYKWHWLAKARRGKIWWISKQKVLLKQISILICILFDEKKFKVNTRLNLHAFRVSSRLKAFAKKLLGFVENESYVSQYQIKTASSWKVFSFWSHPKKNLEFYDPNKVIVLWPFQYIDVFIVLLT